MAAPTALLYTKLAPPRLRSEIVIRPELVAMLDESRTAILVSAPPGYGKTTLIASWLAAAGQAAAWLTLDETDNDGSVFVAYLLAAARRTVPGLEPLLDPTLASPQHPAAALTPLLNALVDAAVPLVIVLDDYHVIHDQTVHELVGFLVGHLPPATRLVIATREDPPLPLSRLRARGQLTELRAADLRMDSPAAAEFLRRSMQLDVSDETVERLTERAEGWAAGLQLAGLSLHGAADPDAFVDAFDASDRYIVDYLVDEALARQPDAVRTFLADTSILDRLTGPLCDAVTGRDDGSEMLPALERANLFLVALDERREWFRYHALFADLLRSGLPQARRAALHAAAATWFSEHDLPLDAIRHALAAGDPETAAHTMNKAVDETLARGEFQTILGWCDALPAHVLERHPRLRVSRAWATFFLGDLPGAEHEAAALRDDLEPAELPRLAALDAWLANRRDDPDAAALARRATELVGETDPIFRSLAFTTLGEALIGGDIRAAATAFGESRRLTQAQPNSTLAHGAAYNLASANLILGQRRAAEELCRTTIAEAAARRGGTPPSVGMVHLPLGIALFEADELQRAHQQFAIGLELCDRAGLRTTMLGGAEWYEIKTLHALGDTQQAWRQLEAVRREGQRRGIERVAIGYGFLAAELLVAEGDPIAAERYLGDPEDSLEHLLGSAVERRAFARARVLLALGRPGDAGAILDQLAARQRETGRIGRLIATLVLTAAARQGLGDGAAADGALRAAVALASPEDHRREFVEQPGIDRLLAGVRDESPAFVDDLLGRRATTPRAAAGASAGTATTSTRLSEPLTVRELEVLRLVVAGLSNDEIGRELFVTAGTAKWHVHNLIGKLGARDRVGLVARSRALGLL